MSDGIYPAANHFIGKLKNMISVDEMDELGQMFGTKKKCGHLNC